MLITQYIAIVHSYCINDIFDIFVCIKSQTLFCLEFFFLFRMAFKCKLSCRPEHNTVVKMCTEITLYFL